MNKCQRAFKCSGKFKCKHFLLNAWESSQNRLMTLFLWTFLDAAAVALFIPAGPNSHSGRWSVWHVDSTGCISLVAFFFHWCIILLHHDVCVFLSVSHLLRMSVFSWFFSISKAFLCSHIAASSALKAFLLLHFLLSSLLKAFFVLF